jgi:hypothetical protein
VDDNEYGGNGGICYGSGATGQTGKYGREKNGDKWQGKAGGAPGNSVEANGHVFTYDVGDVGTKIKGPIIA